MMIISFLDLKKVENKITENRNMNKGTKVKIWKEFNTLSFKIVLNEYSSPKLLISEKIKKTIKLDNKQIIKDRAYLKKRSLIIFI